MIEILIVGVCLILNGFFAAFEMAFVSIPRAELKRQSKLGSKEAEKLILLRDNPERTLSVIQIGITLVGALAAAVGGAGAAETLEPMLIESWNLRPSIAEVLSMVIVVLPLTYFSVVVGELVPKTIALRSPGKIVFAGAKVLFIAERVLSPFVTVLEGSTKKIMSRFFKKSKSTLPAGTGTLEIDALSEAHQKLVLNLTLLDSKKMEDLLVEWENVITIKHENTVEEVAAVVLTSGHTRIPVLGISGVLGILHTKEFMALRETGELDWHSLIRPVLRIQERFSILMTLKLMQQRRSHMAIVYSQDTSDLLGVVTMEDILEEIVGDISDEDDDGKVQRVLTSRIKSRTIKN
jgi:putative hemolysin